MGRLTGGRANVTDAQRLLEQWAEKWAPVLPELPGQAAVTGYAAAHPANDQVEAALRAHAGQVTALEMPAQAQIARAGQQAAAAAQTAADTYEEASRRSERELAGHGVYGETDRNLAAQLAEQATAVSASTSCPRTWPSPPSPTPPAGSPPPTPPGPANATRPRPTNAPAAKQRSRPKPPDATLPPPATGPAPAEAAASAANHRAAAVQERPADFDLCRALLAWLRDYQGPILVDLAAHRQFC